MRGSRRVLRNSARREPRAAWRSGKAENAAGRRAGSAQQGRVSQNPPRYALALALALTACGGDATVTPAATTAPPPTTPAAPTTTGTTSLRALGAEVRDAAVAAEIYYSDEGTYAGLTPAILAANEYQPKPGITIAVVSATATRYCLAARSGGLAMYLSSDDGKITTTPCR
jgi:hypothetical protein